MDHEEILQQHDRMIAEHDRWLDDMQAAQDRLQRAQDRLQRAQDRLQTAQDRLQAAQQEAQQAAEERARAAQASAEARDKAWDEKHKRNIEQLNQILRRAVRLSVRDALNERERRRKAIAEIDEKITQLAAAQLITEEKLNRLIERDERRYGGNGGQ